MRTLVSRELPNRKETTHEVQLRPEASCASTRGHHQHESYRRLCGWTKASHEPMDLRGERRSSDSLFPSPDHAGSPAPKRESPSERVKGIGKTSNRRHPRGPTQGGQQRDYALEGSIQGRGACETHTSLLNTVESIIPDVLLDALYVCSSGTSPPVLEKVH